jgi:hypothetical protein
MCNTYFISTANVVTRTRLGIAFMRTLPLLLIIIYVKVTAAAWVRTLAGLCEVFLDKVVLAQVFSQVLSFSSVIVITPLLYVHLRLRSYS